MVVVLAFGLGSETGLLRQLLRACPPRLSIRLEGPASRDADWGGGGVQDLAPHRLAKPCARADEQTLQAPRHCRTLLRRCRCQQTVNWDTVNASNGPRDLSGSAKARCSFNAVPAASSSATQASPAACNATKRRAGAGRHVCGGRERGGHLGVGQLARELPQILRQAPRIQHSADRVDRHERRVLAHARQVGLRAPHLRLLRRHLIAHLPLHRLVPARRQSDVFRDCLIFHKAV